MLPGINHRELLPTRMQFTVNGLIVAHASRESVSPGDVLYVIDSAQGRDVSGLLGDGSDLVMFDRGQHFEVVSVARGGSPEYEIGLRHRGDRASRDAGPVPTPSADPPTSPRQAI